MSVEFRSASSISAVPERGKGVREAAEEIPHVGTTGVERTDAPYQPRVGSYGAWGSCRYPGDLPEKTRGGPDVGAELADDTKRSFGTPLQRSMPLPVEGLRFLWRRQARSGITLRYLLSRDSLRPDLMRFRRIYEAGLVDEASLVLDRLNSEGGGVPYQIPDAIPGDRTFSYSIGEVTYVDRMAEFLFGRVPGAPRRFVLSEVE